MAENKKSFILYTDLIHTFRELTDEEAGKLIKHVLYYVNDLDPQTDDRLVKVAFEPIKQQLKRDLKEWEAERQQRSANGRLGGLKSAETRRSNTKHPFKNEATPSTPSKIEANEAVNVNVNVTDNVNERENIGALANSNLFRQPKRPSFQQVWEAFARADGTKEMAQAFFDKYEATGWFLNGSPIVNYVSLANKFITNWKTNEKPKRNYIGKTDFSVPGTTRQPL